MALLAHAIWLGSMVSAAFVKCLLHSRLLLTFVSRAHPKYCHGVA